MGMSLADGGHLSHGMHLNFSGRYFNVVSYGVRDDDESIDYDAVERLAKEHKPKLIVAGASAYSLHIDFKRFAEIAHSVGALLMADVAHYAGLIAAGVYPTPFGYADIVTTTTHKSLRGPRGGLIFCRPDLEKKINSAVFPGTQGGPLMHVIAAKAVALGEALKPEFKEYGRQVLKNAAVLAETLQQRGQLEVKNFYGVKCTEKGKKAQYACNPGDDTANAKVSFVHFFLFVMAIGYLKHKP